MATRAKPCLEFGEGRSISDLAVLKHCLDKIAMLSAAIMSQVQGGAINSCLRESAQAAQTASIFGVPTLRSQDGELFQVDDQLDHAVTWAQQL